MHSSKSSTIERSDSSLDSIRTYFAEAQASSSISEARTPATAQGKSNTSNPAAIRSKQASLWQSPEPKRDNDNNSSSPSQPSTIEPSPLLSDHLEMPRLSTTQYTNFVLLETASASLSTASSHHSALPPFPPRPPSPPHRPPAIPLRSRPLGDDASDGSEHTDIEDDGDDDDSATDEQPDDFGDPSGAASEDGGPEGGERSERDWRGYEEGSDGDGWEWMERDGTDSFERLEGLDELESGDDATSMDDSGADEVRDDDSDDRNSGDDYDHGNS